MVPLLKIASLCLVILPLICICDEQKLGPGVAGMIKITSNAGYATYFMVDYLLNGEMVRYTSSVFAAGGQSVLEIPIGATRTELVVENCVFIFVWNQVFRKIWEKPPTICYHVWGSTVHPEWEERSC